MIEHLRDVQSPDWHVLQVDAAHLKLYITPLATTNAPFLTPFSITIPEALTIVVDLFAEDGSSVDYGKRMQSGNSPDVIDDRP